MAIATTSQFWNYRLNGDDPTNPVGTNNGTWTTESGSGTDTDAYWVVNAGYWKVVPTTDEYTIFAAIQYTSVPTDGTVLLRLDNGSRKVEVRSSGQKIELVGDQAVMSDELDISMVESNPTPLILRLTIDSSGNAKLYIREITEDDDGQSMVMSVLGAASTAGKVIRWGNTDGSVKWASVYATDTGAFAPDELAPSDFATDTLIRMGLSVVQALRSSRRTYLKTHLDSGSIKYGYDISNGMLSKMVPPFVNVVLRGLSSPTFAALGGGRIDQQYDVLIYITSRGTTYEDAYRQSLNIAGEIFDELYTTTGLNGTTDSLFEYEIELQTKLDDEVTICTHLLTLTYQRRINMRHR